MCSFPKGKKTSLLPVSNVTAHTEIVPIKREPPVAIAFGTIQIFGRLLGPIVFDVPMAKYVPCLGKPALPSGELHEPILQLAPQCTVFIHYLVTLRFRGCIVQSI